MYCAIYLVYCAVDVYIDHMHFTYAALTKCDENR